MAKKVMFFVQLRNVLQSACVRQQCGANFNMVNMSAALYVYTPGQWIE